MRNGRARRKDGGFTFLSVLALVAILGIVLAGAGETWHVTRKREREHDLLYVGDVYRKAIESYYQAPPGGQYPKKLEDLLEDKRTSVPIRHLRRLYPDPMTGKKDWGLVAVEGIGISGVYTRSDDKPLKKKGFPPAYRSFEDKAKYSEWKFMALQPDGQPGPGGTPNPQGQPGQGGTPNPQAQPGQGGTPNPQAQPAGTPQPAAPTPGASAAPAPS